MIQPHKKDHPISFFLIYECDVEEFDIFSPCNNPALVEILEELSIPDTKYLAFPPIPFPEHSHQSIFEKSLEKCDYTINNSNMRKFTASLFLESLKMSSHRLCSPIVFFNDSEEVRDFSHKLSRSNFGKLTPTKFIRSLADSFDLKNLKGITFVDDVKNNEERGIKHLTTI